MGSDESHLNVFAYCEGQRHNANGNVHKPLNSWIAEAESNRGPSGTEVLLLASLTDALTLGQTGSLLLFFGLYFFVSLFYIYTLSFFFLCTCSLSCFHYLFIYLFGGGRGEVVVVVVEGGGV